MPNAWKLVLAGLSGLRSWRRAMKKVGTRKQLCDKAREESFVPDWCCLGGSFRGRLVSTNAAGPGELIVLIRHLDFCHENHQPHHLSRENSSETPFTPTLQA